MKETIKFTKPIGYILPYKLNGRSLKTKVIPTVCNLENMLKKLVKVNGDYYQLKQWERRSYNAYLIDKIKNKILISSPDEWKDIIREHILQCSNSDLGASVIDIYLVAYVAENYGIGKYLFFRFIKDTGISDKENSAQAIWQVGKGDGVYLNILHNNGSVRDWDFMKCWVENKC